MAYEWSVKVAGGEIRDLCLDGQTTIRYGRSSPNVQPEPTSATIRMLTYDAAPPLFSEHPSYILNPNTIPSGFIDLYTDIYAGAVTTVELGAPVVIGVSSASGFTDVYEDVYTGGISEGTRFTGYVASLDYDPGAVTLLAVTDQEKLARVDVRAEDYPGESDVERVARVAAEAGIAITVDEGTPKNVVPETASPTRAGPYLQNMADDCEATLIADRSGVVHYRPRDSHTPRAVTVPPSNTLVDPLQMSLEASRVENAITVEYGVADDQADPPTPRPTTTATDENTISTLGKREALVSVMLADQDDAEAYAQRRVESREPKWDMPRVTVLMVGVSDALVSDIANLELGDRVTLPQLLPGSPDDEYTATLIGYTETISRDEWQVELHLMPSPWKAPPPPAGQELEPVTFDVRATSGKDGERKCYENNVINGTTRPDGYIHESASHDGVDVLTCTGWAPATRKEK